MAGELSNQEQAQQLQRELISFCEERMQWALRMYPEQLRPNQETQAEYTAEWLEMADEVGAERFSAALVRAVRESEFFPVIAKIRKACGIGTAQQSVAESSAAWLWLEKYIQKWPLYEYYDGVRPLTPDAPEIPARIAYAVRLCGGLMRIQNASEKDLPFVKRDFIAAFEGYAESSAALSSMMLEHPLTPAKELKAAPEDNFAERLLDKLSEHNRMDLAKPKEEKSLDLDANREALQRQKEFLLKSSTQGGS